jgi:hypothetical protein
MEERTPKELAGEMSLSLSQRTPVSDVINLTTLYE